MDNKEIIEKLFITMTEIDARHNSDGGEPCFSFLTWNELCDMGIALFNKLKHTNE